MNKKKELFQNTILLTIGTILTKSLQFIMVPFFTKWLSVSDYGTFDLICTYITLLIPIVTLSTSQSIFRFSIDESNYKQKTVISSGFFLYLINIIVLTLIMVIIMNVLDWKLSIPFLILFISQTLNDYFQGFVRGIKKINIYSICMALTTLLIAIFTTILIKVFNMGLVGIIYGYSMGYLFGDIFILFFTKYWKYFSLKLISLSKLKEMIKYSYTLIFNDISWWIVNVSDRTIISIFINSAANGVYAIANKIPSLCTSIFSMFSISWQQTASEIVDSKDRNKFINEIYNSSTAIIISLCICIISCNFILFNYIFTEEYIMARWQVPILIFAIILNSMSQFMGGIQISLKNPKENGLSTIYAAIINILINLMFIKVIGLYAASISTFLSNLFIVIFRKNRLRNKINLKLERIVKIYFVVFLYYFLSQYIFTNNLVISIINLLLACFIFCYINKKIINRILNRFIKKLVIN